MYATVLILHSIFRWIVLLALIYVIFRAARGYFSETLFSKFDNHVRHWTATIAHLQLILGMLVFIKSPFVRLAFSNFWNGSSDWNLTFFGIIHPVLMFISIIVITIGSAKAKRKDHDRQKFKTMLLMFSIALLIIFLAIPWPFSPLANRPYIRTF